MDTSLSAGLSSDQLLEYIKKQKVRIKRLEKENETIRKDKESRGPGKGGSGALNSDPMLFWEMIAREKPFLKNVARAALGHFMTSFGFSSLGTPALLNPRQQKKVYWTKWVTFMLKSRTAEAEKVSNESKAAAKEYEVKITKLKALLSKTHSANQRNLEETNAYKKAQEETATALKNLKLKDEIDRVELMESVRMKSIESAFQYDMEMAIQRAAEDMLSQQMLAQGQSSVSSGTSSGPSNSKRVRELEDEKSSLERELQDIRDALKTSSEKILERDAIITKSRLSVAEQQTSLEAAEEEIASLRRAVVEQREQNQLLEIELDATLANRTQTYAAVAQTTADRVNERVEAVSKELEDTKARLEHAEREARAANFEIEKNRNDIASVSRLKGELRDAKGKCEHLEGKVEHLNEVLVETTKPTPTLSMSTQTDHSNSFLDEEDATIIRTSMDQLMAEAGLTQECTKALLDLSRTRLTDELKLGPLRLHWASEMSSLVDSVMHVLSEVFSDFAGADEEYEGGYSNGLSVTRSNGYAAASRGQGNSAQSHQMEERLNVHTLLERLEARSRELQTQHKVVKQVRERFAPMTWEASSVTVGRNKEIFVPIPLPAFDRHADLSQGRLEWLLLGENANQVELSLAPLASKAELTDVGRAPKKGANGDALILASVMHQDHLVQEVRGLHNVPLQSKETFYALKLKNKSIWADTEITYKIRLWLKDDVDLDDSAEEALADELAYVVEKRDRLRNVRAAGLALMGELEDVNAHMTHTMAAAQSIVVEQSNSVVSRLESLSEKEEALSMSLHKRLEGLQEAVEDVQHLVSAARLEAIDNCDGSTAAMGAKRRRRSSAVSVGSTKGEETRTEELAVYSCESLTIKAADDFRLCIPRGLFEVPYAITWEVSMPNTVMKRHTLGFSICDKKEDGYLNQMVAHKRMTWTGGRGRVSVTEDTGDVIILFDNTFSFLSPKDVKYKVTVIGSVPSESEQIDEVVNGAGANGANASVGNSTQDLSTLRLRTQNALQDLLEEFGQGDVDERKAMRGGHGDGDGDNDDDGDAVALRRAEAAQAAHDGAFMNRVQVHQQRQEAMTADLRRGLRILTGSSLNFVASHGEFLHSLGIDLEHESVVATT